MQKNKRGRPKKQQEKQQNGNTSDRLNSARESKQQDRQCTTPQYDKIMAQIKETYASLNDANLQKQQIQEPQKKMNKNVKANKKMKRILRQTKKPQAQEENVKLESQDQQENLDSIKTKFNQIFKNFIDNVKGEIFKTEQELLKISDLK